MMEEKIRSDRLQNAWTISQHFFILKTRASCKITNIPGSSFLRRPNSVNWSHYVLRIPIGINFKSLC